MNRRTIGAAALAAWLLLSCTVRAEEPVGYNRHVRAILVDNCFACHGPDSAARKADLRLDQRDSALEMGAIVPGKPDESELISRILSDDADVQMPPPSSHKKLTAEQKDVLARWIAAGAEYEPHWLFIPPERPAPPQVQDASWPANAIDHFVLAKLEAAGLRPAPDADRRTLARRVSLDLTGLPPDPAEVDAFVADTSPDAYERFVDKLLESPHWGEHRGRYWLDAARYADTHGIHFDNFREMWSYRDWVIAAFNRNLPFDEFTIEQLAGDLLPERSLDQLIASGFNRCNMTTNEGGIIDEEYLVLYTRDRAETVSQVWLGMTAGCAVCHDHKFDPLTQREFYELAAFFNNTTQDAKDGNIKDTPPIVVVPQAEDRAAWETLPGQQAEVARQIDERRSSGRGDFDAWLADTARPAMDAPILAAPASLYAPLAESAGSVLAATIDGQPRVVDAGKAPDFVGGVTADQAFRSQGGTTVAFPTAGDFEKDQAFTCTVWVKVPRKDLSGAIVARMDNGNQHRGWDLWLDNGRPAAHIIHAWPENALKVIGRTPLAPGAWHCVTMVYDGSGRAAGVKLYVGGALQEVDVASDSLKDTIRTTVALKLAERESEARIDRLALQDLRLYARELSAEEVSQLALVPRAAYLADKPADARSEEETGELFAWWLEGFDPVYRELAARNRELEVKLNEIKARATIAHVMQEKESPPTAFVLFRGEYDKRRDEVQADTPDVLPPFPGDLPRNRLGFAHWLLRPEHPTTARVTVNRFWQEVFGAGLVKTSGDLGVVGELPSHPELLDWLSVDFRENGWDVKRFFRQLVLSRAYRQAALVTPEKIERDRDNTLLSRGPRFRMDAEMVRDHALAASGLLMPKLGGPSVRPYQPDGVWEAVAMIGSNTRDYRRDSGENLYRRSLYTFWKRAAPPASMEIFNAPNREICTVRRERTNTPLQALMTLNDPQYVEAARHLAARTLREGGDSDAARLDFVVRRLLARPLDEREQPLAVQSLETLRTYYRGHVDDARQLIAVGESPFDETLDPAELAGWTMMVNQLMNLDEVLNK